MSFHKGNSVWVVLLAVLAEALVSCQPTPQRAKHLSASQEVDSTLLAQMQFNMRMSDAADKACQMAIENDSLRYAQDDYGFWYAKIVARDGELLQQGQEVNLHIQLSELDGTLLADTKSCFTVGAGDLPLAITRALKIMNKGEQMRIVAPWYTAYGVEGTKLIEPYTNLLIILTIEE